MTDINTALGGAAPTPDPAAPPPAAAPEKDYKALYEQEVQERTKERNLYRPVQRIMQDLAEDDIAALTDLADRVRGRDVNGIVDWSLATAQNVTGASDLAQLIAQRQNQPTGQAPLGQTPTVQPTAPTPQQGIQQPTLDHQEVQRLVQQQLREQMALQEQRTIITNQLTDAGYPPQTAAGQTIIQYAAQNNTDIPTAVAWYEKDIQSVALERARQAAGAAGSVPQPAPQGAPAPAPAQNMTPQERVAARVRSWNSQ